VRKTAAPVAATAVPVAAVAVQPVHDNWWRSMLTDHAGEFDTGRILVAVVIVAMCAIQSLDVYYNKAVFKPNEFGIGIGAVLAGFAMYLYGDAKRPEAGKTTTVQVAQTTTT
jgi:hypothetical protein